jgi:hypothetical protein
MDKVGIHILWPFGNIIRSFGNLVAIWYILPRVGILSLEKSGNPALENFVRYEVPENSSCNCADVRYRPDSLSTLFVQKNMLATVRVCTYLHSGLISLSKKCKQFYIHFMICNLSSGTILRQFYNIDLSIRIKASSFGTKQPEPAKTTLQSR